MNIAIALGIAFFFLLFYLIRLSFQVKSTIDLFITSIGKGDREQGERILEWCLGSEWRQFTIGESLEHFNEKLGLDLSPRDPLLETAKKIREAWLDQYK